jgi:signal transduction histidine kinase
MMGVATSVTDRRPSAAYWTAMVVLPVVFLSAAAWIDHPPALDPAFLHERAQALAADSPDPPAQAQCSDDLKTLPFLVDSDHDGFTTAWYCIPFDAPDGADVHEALLLIGARASLSVRLNGWFVGETNPFVEPLELHREPLWFDLPAAALKPGRNALWIHSASDLGFAYLPPMYIGPRTVLRPAFDRARFIRIGFVDATIATMVVLTLFMVGMFALRPRDTVYAWFAACIGSWALHTYCGHAPRPLVGNALTWIGISDVMLGWFVCFAAIFVNRVTGPHPRDRALERGVLIFGIVGGALEMWSVIGEGAIFNVHLYLWVPGMLVIGLLLVWRLARTSLTTSNEEARMLLLVAFLVFVVGVRDYVHDLRHGAGFGYGSVNLLVYTVGAVLTVYTFFLLKRVTHALTDAEVLNHELEDRVAGKVLQIEQYHRQMLRLEQQQAALRERERITRDVHDGIGGHLIHALSMAESDPAQQDMESVLRAALGDLRMVIDSSEPVDGDLTAVLAMMRNRCERRIAQAGLRFDWQVAELPTMPNLGPHHVLQILRILEEALTNVIRHAAATTVTVRTQIVSLAGAPGKPASGTVCVEIADDGCGLGGGTSALSVSRGYGLRNMQKRAADIGGHCSITRAARGTCVRLTLPVALSAPREALS